MIVRNEMVMFCLFCFMASKSMKMTNKNMMIYRKKRVQTNYDIDENLKSRMEEDE